MIAIVEHNDYLYGVTVKDDHPERFCLDVGYYGLRPVRAGFERTDVHSETAAVEWLTEHGLTYMAAVTAVRKAVGRGYNPRHQALLQSLGLVD